VTRVLLAGAAFLAVYVSLVALDQWLRELLLGFGEVAVTTGLLLVDSSGGRKSPPAQGESVGELLTADIDEIPAGNAA
jgi:hypothetical protein